MRFYIFLYALLVSALEYSPYNPSGADNLGVGSGLGNRGLDGELLGSGLSGPLGSGLDDGPLGNRGLDDGPLGNRGLDGGPLGNMGLDDGPLGSGLSGPLGDSYGNGLGDAMGDGLGGPAINNAPSAVHGGNTGENTILLAKDIMHNNDGKDYVGESNGISPHANIDHNTFDNMVLAADQDALNAQLETVNKEKQLLEKEHEMAALKEKANENYHKLLTDLHDKANTEAEKTPEVLAKVTVPYVVFTQESMPLIHHTKDVLKKIGEINAEQDKIIESQKEVTKLEDNSDGYIFPKDKAAVDDLFRRFLVAGNILRYLKKVPVFDKAGRFYLGANEHGGESADYGGGNGNGGGYGGGYGDGYGHDGAGHDGFGWDNCKLNPHPMPIYAGA